MANKKLRNILENYVEPLIPYSLFWKMNTWGKDTLSIEGRERFSKKMTKSIVSTAVSTVLIPYFVMASLSWGTCNPFDQYKLSKVQEENKFISYIHEKDSLHNQTYLFNFWDVNKDGFVNRKDYELTPEKWDRNIDGVVDGHDVKISKEKPIGIQYKGLNR